MASAIWAIYTRCMHRGRRYCDTIMWQSKFKESGDEPIREEGFGENGHDKTETEDGLRTHEGVTSRGTYAGILRNVNNLV